MAKEVIISIDNRDVHSSEGTSIIDAASRAGIYIPRLCLHPDLPPGPGTKADSHLFRHGEICGDGNGAFSSYDGCDICVVEIEGRGICPSCATIVENGMIIHSETAPVKELRKNNLAKILATHPHACLLCSESGGCDREMCPQGEVKDGRCCSIFGDCEFQKVCKYVTIKDDVPQFISKSIPIIDTPFFTVNTNLCIGCTRCIRACEKMQGKRVIGFTYRDGIFEWGTTGPSHRESGCVYCGACVAVCPTGALLEKGVAWKKKEKLTFTPVMLPPEEMQCFTKEEINNVPEINGVYHLFDDTKEIIYIRGAENVRADLMEKLQTVENARFFKFEEHGMYTMVENELLSHYLKKHGKLPEVNNEISDLY